MLQPILLVEDDLSLAQTLASTLENMGLPVQHSSSGELAIELLRTHSYSVAVVDVILGGVSGLYVVNTIRKMPANRRPQVIVMTGAKIESLRGIDPTVVAAVLLKPVDFNLFAEYVVATYRHALAVRSTASPPVHTFCGSCHAEIPPWTPDRLPISDGPEVNATLDAWLDSPCPNCGSTPRVSGGRSAWSQ